jgi:NAD-dependent oxidoreductase involved in siderophore biosynthesis
MKKIVILGCENSHANHFLKAIKEEYRDVEVVGIYSDEPEAAKKLNEEFGAPIMNSFDEAAGKIDGVVITARHGDNHYKYAKPYIESGIPMFIDKPITCNGEEAVSFMQELKAAGVNIRDRKAVKAYYENKQKLAEEEAAKKAAADAEAARIEREKNPTTEDLLKMILAEMKK